MNINDNRRLYDLCRKYKYLYKKHEEIKHLDECYWSKYIRDAYKESEKELDEVTDEITKWILKQFIHRNSTSLEFSQDVSEYYRRDGRCVPVPHSQRFEVIVENKDFYKVCCEMLKEEMRGSVKV